MSQLSSDVSGSAEALPAGSGLRSACLSYSEVIAQSVSVIAPSTVPAAVLGLIIARAGNAAWLSFVIGTLGLILVSLNINQFARRSASPESLYSYIVQGLGPTAGVLGGGALSFGYTLTGMSTLCGFATGRILYSMAQHGVVANGLGHAHQENGTPHVAVGVAALFTFGVPTAVYLAGVSAFDAQGQFGTLCSFGFILVYILISAAAPAYLASLGKLTCRSRAYCLGALGFLLLPLLGTIGIPGSELFPTPDASGLVLLGVFMTYMGLGLGWLLLQRARPPTLVGDMQDAIERVHLEFAPTLAASSLTSTVADPASRA